MNKTINTVIDAGFQDVAGAEDVVAHGFPGSTFHKRDVLVGGGVEDDLGLQEPKVFVHDFPFSNAGDAGDELDGVALGDEGFVNVTGELEFQVVQGIFVDIDNNQLFGMEANNLSGKFGSDGAGAAGDEDGFSA